MSQPRVEDIRGLPDRLLALETAIADFTTEYVLLTAVSVAVIDNIDSILVDLTPYTIEYRVAGNPIAQSIDIENPYVLPAKPTSDSRIDVIYIDTLLPIPQVRHKVGIVSEYPGEPTLVTGEIRITAISIIDGQVSIQPPTIQDIGIQWVGVHGNSANDGFTWPKAKRQISECNAYQDGIIGNHAGGTFAFSQQLSNSYWLPGAILIEGVNLDQAGEIWLKCAKVVGNTTLSQTNLYSDVDLYVNNVTVSTDSAIFFKSFTKIAGNFIVGVGCTTYGDLQVLGTVTITGTHYGIINGNVYPKNYVKGPVASTLNLLAAFNSIDGKLLKETRFFDDGADIKIYGLPEKNTLTNSGFGYLYNGYATTDIRNLANTGWKVPSVAELNTLCWFVIYYQLPATYNNARLLVEQDIDWWSTILPLVTNSLGFNARGAGLRNPTFSAFKENLALMANEGEDPNTIGGLTISYYGDTSYYISPSSLNFLNRYEAGSVRLLKDSTTLTHGQKGTYIGNDGKIYRTICIGTQEWLADNLAETKFRDGSSIPTVTDQTTWVNLTSAAKCAYNNDEQNVGSITSTEITGKFVLQDSLGNLVLVDKDKVEAVYEKVSNKTTVIDSNSTNIQYAAAKAVFDLLNAKTHNTLTGLNSGDYRHLTALEYTGVGTGVFVRKDSPVFTTKITTPRIDFSNGCYITNEVVNGITTFKIFVP